MTVARILIVGMALLQAANTADCCCGHHCLTPNDVCRESPLRGQEQDTGSC